MCAFNLQRYIKGCIAATAGAVGEKWRNPAPEDVVRLPRWPVHRNRVNSNERCTVWLTVQDYHRQNQEQEQSDECRRRWPTCCLLNQLSSSNRP